MVVKPRGARHRSHRNVSRRVAGEPRHPVPRDRGRAPRHRTVAAGGGAEVRRSPEGHAVPSTRGGAVTVRGTSSTEGCTRQRGSRRGKSTLPPESTPTPRRHGAPTTERHRLPRPRRTAAGTRTGDGSRAIPATPTHPKPAAGHPQRVHPRTPSAHLVRPRLTLDGPRTAIDPIGSTGSTHGAPARHLPSSRRLTRPCERPTGGWVDPDAASRRSAPAGDGWSGAPHRSARTVRPSTPQRTDRPRTGAARLRHRPWPRGSAPPRHTPPAVWHDPATRRLSATDRA